FPCVASRSLRRGSAAVLLTNDDGALPLRGERLATEAVLIGELARTSRYQGSGSSQVSPTQLESILDSLTELGLQVPFAPGYRLAEADVEGAAAAGESRTDAELRAEAVEAARGKSAVLVLGLPAADESEGYDREHMEIPDSHQELLREVAEVAE